jgi:predicted RecB family endonuclease
MKHIQNFNKFNEEVGMGMFPVDVVKSAPDAYKDIFAGVSDLYNDVVDEMGNKIKELKDAFKGVSEQEVEKIAQFMKKTFGTVTPEMTKENGIKLAKALGLDTISENLYANNFESNKIKSSNIRSKSEQSYNTNSALLNSKLYELNL